MVSVKALITDDSRVLLLKRYAYDGSLFWDLPGGCSDNPNDTYQTTIQREIGEEIGYHGPVGVGPIIGVQRWYIPESGYPAKTTLVFVVNTLEPLTVLQLSDEHHSYRWVSASDLERAGEDCRFKPELLELLERFFAGRY